MHLVMGGAAVSHRDLVSIIPYSSVAAADEDDDKITARQDARRPQPVAIDNHDALSPDRQDAIRVLVSHLDSWPPEEMLLADDGQTSPGSREWRDLMTPA